MAFGSLKGEATPTIDELFKPISTLDPVVGLKTLLSGHPEVGKTGTIGTMAFMPGAEPVYVIDTEWGCRQVFKTWFPDKDIRVFEVKVVGDDPTKIDAEKTFTKIEQALYALRDIEEGSIAIDSFSDIYRWMNEWVEDTAPRYRSKASKEEFMMRTEWGKRNKRYRSMVFKLLAKPVHVVATAQMQSLYDKGGNELDEEKPSLHKPHRHWCDVWVEMQKWATQGRGARYESYIRKCRQHRASNHRISNLTFPKLIKELRTEFGVKIAGVNYDKLDGVIKSVDNRFKMKPEAIEKAFG